MKKTYQILSLIALFTFASCTKDDPSIEIDQEELGTATLTFTEVERELHTDHYDYNPVENGDVEEVKFTPVNNQFLPPVGAHLHLEVGKTYRLDLKSTDFAGRESQHTFVTRADIHQAFILGAPANALEYAYADKDAANNVVNVGVTGYITVKEKSDSFVLNYIMRHLNPGVKSNVKATDWNHVDYNRFTGANDLDLKVEVHLVEENHDH